MESTRQKAATANIAALKHLGWRFRVGFSPLTRDPISARVRRPIK